MSITLNKDAYKQLIQQDLEFLSKHCPNSPELDHIKLIVCKSIDDLYPEFKKPKCDKCHDKGSYTIGGSFGGGATEIQCTCKCDHPVESRTDYHDNSILCTKCYKVIAQNGIFF